MPSIPVIRERISKRLTLILGTHTKAGIRRESGGYYELRAKFPNAMTVDVYADSLKELVGKTDTEEFLTRCRMVCDLVTPESLADPQFIVALWAKEMADKITNSIEADLMRAMKANGMKP